MPTEEEKRRELEKVTKSSGFRAGIHDFLAETNFEKLKKRNEKWGAAHRGQSLADRKSEELLRIAVHIAMRYSVPHIQIHVHAAHQAGATAQEIYELIELVGSWTTGDAAQNGLEAWRLVFRPDLPTIFRVVELTSDSFDK